MDKRSLIDQQKIISQNMITFKRLALVKETITQLFVY